MSMSGVHTIYNAGKENKINNVQYSNNESGVSIYS